MSFLLDTSVCVAYLRGRDPALRDRLLARPTDDFRLCSVVKAELLYSARKSARVEENLRRLQRFFEPFPSLPSCSTTMQPSATPCFAASWSEAAGSSGATTL